MCGKTVLQHYPNLGKMYEFVRIHCGVHIDRCLPLDLEETATYRIVVCGETAGTVSKFKCIHLTVVRKHKQRLGQQTTECGPLVSSNKATGRSRHEDKSWPAPSAIAC